MRIGVLGLGFMGTTHLKAMRNVPRAELVAVCSNDEQKLSGDLSTVQGNLGGPGERFDFSGIGRYTDVDQIMADPRVEAVDICLPTDLHTEVTLKALRAGKHVLVEKPMALDGPSADLMLSEAQRSGCTLMVAQVLRFVPPYRALVDALKRDGVGPVRTALFRRRCAAPFWSKWLGDASKSGGGIFDLLIHDIDFCIKLFGMPDAVSATGHEDAGAGVDVIAAHLFYSRGPSVLVTGGWHHRKAYPFSMEYTVTADGATFEYNFLRGDSTVYDASGEAYPMEVPPQDGFEAELQYFVECCETGKRPEYCPPEESARAVKLMLLILDARTRNGEKLACRI
jgi:predicted dehydrogenase